MGAIQMSIGYACPVVELPCAFIDHYMPRCTPVYALIYIYSLRQCIGGAAAVSSQEIGQTFQILETDVIRAWRYWESEGLIKLEERGDGMAVTFLPAEVPVSRQAVLPAKPALYALPAAREIKAPEPAEAPQRDSGDSNLAQPTQPEDVPHTAEVKPFVPASRPVYTVEELTVYQQQSRDIQRLFTHAEQSLGKMLTYHDMNLIFGFYDWLRLPVDVIGYLLTYCAENGHGDLRYVEKAAIDWAENQIDDVEKALAYVQTFDRDYREILRAMGQNSGYPTPSQRKYIDKWLREYRMSTILVLEACDRAATQIGKPRFTYVDKILEDWHKKGIQTPADVEADAQEFARKKTENAKTEPKARTTRNSRYVNFAQRDRDYATLEQMEREYKQQLLKG